MHRAPKAQHEVDLTSHLFRASTPLDPDDESVGAVRSREEAGALEMSTKVFDHRVDRDDSHRAADVLVIGEQGKQLDCPGG
jgi:hypothetical protein